jgi:hypothetical protein
MKHLTIRYNRVTNEWFCIKCGKTSTRPSIDDARLELDRNECLMPTLEHTRAELGTETARLLRKPFNVTVNTERSGCRFAVTKTDEGKPVIKLELFHDTVSRLKSLTIGFDLLGGVTPEQTRTLVDAMNEKIVGVIVIPK